MIQEEIESAILKSLYVAFFQSGDDVNLDAIREELHLDNNAFWKIADFMEHRGLIKAIAMGGWYGISSAGILHAEKIKTAPEDILKENQHARTVMLDSLARTYEEGSSYSDTDIETLSSNTGLSTKVIGNNLDLLDEVGYIESVAIASYKITYRGLASVEEWRLNRGLEEEFNQISALSPQPRGRAFQKFFAKVVEKDGWSQEEGARTSHEEMDVVIHKHREYFLIECKWEKDAIEANVVRELHGKLSNRVGIQGMIVSMSGFSAGAITQAESYANSKIIIFFGEDDVKALLAGKSSFDAVLDAKYQQVITRRKIVFE